MSTGLSLTDYSYSGRVRSLKHNNSRSYRQTNGRAMPLWTPRTRLNLPPIASFVARVYTVANLEDKLVLHVFVACGFSEATFNLSKWKFHFKKSIFSARNPILRGTEVHLLFYEGSNRQRVPHLQVSVVLLPHGRWNTPVGKWRIGTNVNYREISLSPRTGVKSWTSVYKARQAETHDALSRERREINLVILLETWVKSTCLTFTYTTYLAPLCFLWENFQFHRFYLG